MGYFSYGETLLPEIVCIDLCKFLSIVVVRRLDDTAQLARNAAKQLAPIASMNLSKQPH